VAGLRGQGRPEQQGRSKCQYRGAHGFPIFSGNLSLT
jgi:hypothetical protein